MLPSKQVPFLFTIILFLAGLGQHAAQRVLPDCVLYPRCLITKDPCCM
ncbi:accessory gland peptide Acp33A [Drosophila mauritiana]|uniref:Accessory gland peptide Acp33A n=1 Tax=Drosophila mauritiana TaxID=7226 RepID=A0A6P8KBY4_DROMA|nr:accessory gland peptide Acp33A [Drosophila mauritiana]